MAEESAKLRIPYIAASQAQKHVTHNEAMTLLDTLVQLSVLDKDLTAPPAEPEEGDTYIVGASATGAWEGWDHRVARFIDGTWRSYLPGAGDGAGWLAFVLDEQLIYRFDGSAWAPAFDSFVPDAVVDEIADRDEYDDEAANFSVLVTEDAGNGNQPTLYFKLSGSSADWSNGIDWLPQGGGGAADFTDLGDAPDDYAGHGGKAVAVAQGEDGLEFVEFPEGGEPGEPGQSFQPDAVVDAIAGRDDYDDEEAAFSVLVIADSGNDSQPTLYFKLSATTADWSAGITWVPQAEPGASDFTDLGDVPASYEGHGGKAVAVTDGEDGLEFVDFPEGGGASGFFHVHKNGTNQTGITSGADTALTWATEVADDANVFDLPNHEVTPTAGTWLMEAMVSFQGAGAGGNVVDQQPYRFVLYKDNGGGYASDAVIQEISASGTSTQRRQAAFLVQANGTDKYKIYVTGFGAGDKIIQGAVGNTYWKGRKLGD